MIQDIEPSVMDIEFKDKEISECDKVILIVDDKVVLKKKQDFEAFSFGEIKSLCFDEKKDKHGAEYFCKIDEEYYYIINLESEKYKKKELENSVIIEDQNDFRWLKPKHLGFACITALHIFYFRNKNKFCGNCGSKMVKRGDERAQVCNDCGNTVYPIISPAIIVGIVDGNRLLITGTKVHKAANRPALVSGYCEIGETLEATIKREVMEEVGIKVKNIVYYGSQPWGFSRSLLMGFFAEVDGDSKISLNDGELSEAFWVEREDIVPFDKGVAITGEMIKFFKNGGNPFKRP